MKLITKNKQALYDYEILETFEAGLKLSGPEVRSIKLGQVQLKNSFCSIDQGKILIKHMHISPYKPASRAQELYCSPKKRSIL